MAASLPDGEQSQPTGTMEAPTGRVPGLLPILMVVADNFLNNFIQSDKPQTKMASCFIFFDFFFILSG